jgi:hypothetical protein
MTLTNHCTNRKLEQANTKPTRSKKWQVYIGNEDSGSDISSLHSDDTENDTNALVEVCYLSKKSIEKSNP